MLIVQYPMICLWWLESPKPMSLGNIWANWGSLKDISNPNIVNFAKQPQHKLWGIFLAPHQKLKKRCHQWLVIISIMNTTSSKRSIWMESGPANLKGKITFNHVVSTGIFSTHAKIFVQLLQVRFNCKSCQKNIIKIVWTHRSFFLKWLSDKARMCVVLLKVWGCNFQLSLMTDWVSHCHFLIRPHTLVINHTPSGEKETGSSNYFLIPYFSFWCFWF